MSIGPVNPGNGSLPFPKQFPNGTKGKSPTRDPSSFAHIESIENTVSLSVRLMGEISKISDQHAVLIKRILIISDQLRKFPNCTSLQLYQVLAARELHTQVQKHLEKDVAKELVEHFDKLAGFNQSTEEKIKTLESKLKNKPISESQWRQTHYPIFKDQPAVAQCRAILKMHTSEEVWTKALTEGLERQYLPAFLAYLALPIHRLNTSLTADKLHDFYTSLVSTLGLRSRSEVTLLVGALVYTPPKKPEFKVPLPVKKVPEFSNVT